MDPLELSQLLCARICHDMAGPIGAASAGAELFEDLDGPPDPETLGLVAASAQSGANRLKFFRQTLGPAASQPQSMPFLRDLCEGYLRTVVSASLPPVRLSWPSQPSHLDGEMARLLLNMVLLSKDCLPRGGLIQVDMAAGLPTLNLSGDPASLNDEARAVLVEGKPPTGPKGAQAWLTRALAERTGGGLVLDYTEKGLRLGVGQ